ncbi:MAG: nucleoside hydrolase [Segetibacter sp.]
MKTRIIVIGIFILMASSAVAQKKGKARPVIFDSDMGPDYDDVGAIAMLHAFADSGYINILATIANTKYEGVAGVFNVLNTYFNRPDLPIGVPKNGLDMKDRQHWSDTLLANYTHSIKSNNEVPEAAALYRRLLSRQPDKSVTIITVGFFTNLANLLQSGADQYSKLIGKELVQKKVKGLISMAGRFPSGKEFNVEKDAAASQVVFSQWPTPILLSGFEIGMKIKVGLPLVKNEKIVNNPVKDVFRISIPKAKEDSAGRMSWDETAVFIAARGYEPYYKLKKGRMIVAQDGSNTWKEEGDGHAYLIEKVPFEKVRNEIEHLIQHQPVQKKIK